MQKVGGGDKSVRGQKLVRERGRIKTLTPTFGEKEERWRKGTDEAAHVGREASE